MPRHWAIVGVQASEEAREALQADMHQLQADLEAVLAARQVEAIKQQLEQLTRECERLQAENGALGDRIKDAHASAQVSVLILHSLPHRLSSEGIT